MRIDELGRFVWRQMVAPELKLTKKSQRTKKVRNTPLPRIVVERAPECLRTMKLTNTLEAAQDAQRLHRMEKQENHIMTNAERESETGDAVDVPMEPGRDDEQVAVRHADASGGDITVNQHEEDRMTDIHTGKRGSEAATRSFECCSVFRTNCHSGISCEW